MNKVIIVGRLTRDPEIRTTANSTMASFSVAVDRRFKQEGQPDADFPRVIAWGKTAEFIGGLRVTDRETAERFREKYVNGHKVLFEGWNKLL